MDGSDECGTMSYVLVDMAAHAYAKHHTSAHHWHPAAASVARFYPQPHTYARFAVYR